MPAPANWKTPQRNVKEKSELAKGVSRTGDTRWIGASDDILSNKYASGRLVIKEFVQTDSVPELSERPRSVTQQHKSKEDASISAACANAS